MSTTEPTQTQDLWSRQAYPTLSAGPQRIAYAAVAALVVLPLLVYLVSAEFYTKYVLSEQLREYQAIELLTFTFGVTAGVLLAIAAVKLWRLRPGPDYGPAGARGWPDRYGAFVVGGLSALAMWVLSGEEVNWGQTFVHWGVPEREKQREIILNLHNTTEDISMQALGSWFVYLVLLGLPLLWCFRKRLNLPGAWWPAVPIGPAVAATLAGTLISNLKSLYRSFTPTTRPKRSTSITSSKSKSRKKCCLPWRFC